MPFCSSSRQHGFTLVEVMVALLLLGIGIASVGTLQLTSKRANGEAFQHATAVFLARELIERMRANPKELSYYTDSGAGRMITANALAPVDCSTACTTAQMAAFDLYEWQQSLSGNTAANSGATAGALTSPIACITGPAGGAGNYTVAIAWRGRQKLSNPTRSTCGSDSGNYDEGTELNVRRRVVVIDTFIGLPV